MRAFILLPSLAILSLSSAAFGLAQSKHKALSDSACRKAGLPTDFCDEVAVAAYNVDRYEWDDMAAHAQPEVGQPHCDAALAVTTRVHTLATELRTRLAAANATQSTQSLADIAKALGRTLHTVQDNCAHSGVPNDQHAWLSLSDSCLDTESSPDIQPAAVQCAEQETVLTFDAFVTAFEGAGLETSSFKMFKADNEQVAQFFPPRGGVCDFLKSADTWNGIDRRWDNAIMVPAIENQFYTTLVVDPDAPATDVCAGNPNAIAVPETPPVDVSQKIEWCTSIKLYCAGKADGSDTSPPWDTGTPTSTPSAGSSSDSGGGCNLSGSSSPMPTTALALLGLALGLRRRRNSK